MANKVTYYALAPKNNSKSFVAMSLSKEDRRLKIERMYQNTFFMKAKHTKFTLDDFLEKYIKVTIEVTVED